MTDLQLGLFSAPSALELPGRLSREGVELVTTLDGRVVPFRLRRSPRARRLRLVIERSAGLTVIVPLRTPVREVPSALEENAAWILRTLERYRRHRPAAEGGESSDALQATEDGWTVRLLGASRNVRVDRGQAADRARVASRGDEIVICVPALHPEPARSLLSRWLRGYAAAEIPARTRELGSAHGFAPRRISVRDQKTKWGACSPGGNLTFNWRLVLAPLEILDYVIYHELCHLRELNHSHRFWSLLRSLRPAFEAERRWLEEHGPTLRL